jgi:SAM-dependent methyltransferase
VEKDTTMGIDYDIKTADEEWIGMTDELSFWADFVKTDRFLTGWVGDGKTPELNDFVAQFILDQNPEKVLDVGSGVVSILNGLLPQEKITAIDPLGEKYKTIFDYAKYNIQPPIPIKGEEVAHRDEFDIVHMSNALDHTRDPRLVYDNLHRAVKPGGFLILQGFENEGKAQKYQGMHQWDIVVDGRTLWIGKEKERTILARSNYMQTKIIATKQGRNWFIWITKK